MTYIGGVAKIFENEVQSPLLTVPSQLSLDQERIQDDISWAIHVVPWGFQ